MKKIIAIIAMFAFIGVLTSPAAPITEKNSTIIVVDQSIDQQLDNYQVQDQDQDKDQNKDKKKKKKAKKTSLKTKAHDNCGSCDESASCEHANKKAEKSSCCDEKSKNCDEKGKSCDEKKGK